MTVAFDHVILVAEDLVSGSRDLLRATGLASVAGGEHPGQGTANRIVPLGQGYLEVLAVVDGAADSPMVSLVSSRPPGPAVLCLSTDDLDGCADRLGTKPLSMTRTRPDGVTLRWRLAGLTEALADGTPFFIEWDVAPADHPQAMTAAHDVDPTGIAWVELAGDPGRIATVVGDVDIDLRVVDGVPGVRRVGVGLAGGGVLVVGSA